MSKDAGNETIPGLLQDGYYQKWEMCWIWYSENVKTEKQMQYNNYSKEISLQSEIITINLPRWKCNIYTVNLLCTVVVSALLFSEMVNFISVCVGKFN